MVFTGADYSRLLNYKITFCVCVCVCGGGEGGVGGGWLRLSFERSEGGGATKI